MKQYRTLFRNRNFVLLWIGGAISNVGDFFNTLALLKILSQDAGHLGFYLSLMTIAKMVPGLVLGPVAGVLADRLDRRGILIVTDILRAAFVAALVFTSSPTGIVILVFLAASVSAFFAPAHTALLPNLVAPGELVSASSLAFITQRTAQLLGNALGAATLMVMTPHQVFWVDAISFVVSALLTLGIRPMPASVIGRPDADEGQQAGVPAPSSLGFAGKFLGDIKEAGRFLREAPVVRRLLIVFGIANAGDSGLNVLLFTFASVSLGLGAERYGFLIALLGAASVVGGLIVGAMGDRVHWRHLITYGALHIWAAMFAAVLIRQGLPSSALLVAVGLGSGAINVGSNTAFGLLVPDRMRGRIASAWSMMQSAIYIIGVIVAGFLSDRFGPTPVLMAYTVNYLLSGLYSIWAFRGPILSGRDSELANLTDSAS